MSMIEKEVFIISKNDQVVEFCSSMADVATFLGVSLSAVSRALSLERPMRLGYTVQRKPRVYLCKLTQRDYALRGAENIGKDWIAYLDITECYYKGEFVRR